jgi:hypothetical protein
MSGLAPILDFDGTIAYLDVDWSRLRAQFDVERVSDLWNRDPSCWDLVTAAEVGAAAVARPVTATFGYLEETRGFAVLTNNSSVAVHRFFERFPELQRRMKVVVGREELGGPKTDFDRFAPGVARCIAELADGCGGDPRTYVGDSAYELRFAARLGLRAVAVTELGLSVPNED